MLTRGGLIEQGFPARQVWLKENTHFKEQRKDMAEPDVVLMCCGCIVKIVQRWQRSFFGAGRLVLGECGGVEAEGLALIGGERGAVALEVSGNAATGGARTIAERLDASLPLELCCIVKTHAHTRTHTHAHTHTHARTHTHTHTHTRTERERERWSTWQH